MADEYSWHISDLPTAIKVAVGSSGQFSKATVCNDGKASIYIRLFAVEFSWQKDTSLWWTSPCKISLKPGGVAELPAVAFDIPVDAPLGQGSYRCALKLHRWETDAANNGKWVDVGTSWGGKQHPIAVTPHPDRDYTVFVSHSNSAGDEEVLDGLCTLLQNSGIKCFVAERTPKYEQNLWTKILRGIRTSDRTLILWTKAGASSPDVREELGLTVGSRRPFVPVVEQGVDPKGSLIGTEFISFKKSTKEAVFGKLALDLIQLANEKAKRTKRVKPAEPVS